MSQIYLFSGIDGTPFQDFQRQFRLVAAINKWPESDLALILGSYLQGPALEFFKGTYREGVNFKTICESLAAEFPATVNYVESFYQAQQEPGEEPLTYFYRLSDVASKAELTDEKIFIKQFLKSISRELKYKLGMRVYASKVDLKTTLIQMKELFSGECKRLVNLPIQPPNGILTKVRFQHPLTTTVSRSPSPNRETAGSSTMLVRPPMEQQQNVDVFHTPRYNLRSQRSRYTHTNNNALNDSSPGRSPQTPSRPSYRGQLNAVYEKQQVLDMNDNSGQSSPFINVFIGDQLCPALIDTGASISCISAELANELKLKYITSDPVDNNYVKSISGSRLRVVGETSVHFLVDSCFFSHHFVIVKDICQELVLGQDFFYKNDIIIDFGNNSILLKGRFPVKLLSRKLIDNQCSVVNCKGTQNIEINEVSKVGYLYTFGHVHDDNNKVLSVPISKKVAKKVKMIRKSSDKRDLTLKSKLLPRDRLHDVPRSKGHQRVVNDKKCFTHGRKRNVKRVESTIDYLVRPSVQRGLSQKKSYNKNAFLRENLSSNKKYLDSYAYFEHNYNFYNPTFRKDHNYYFYKNV